MAEMKIMFNLFLQYWGVQSMVIPKVLKEQVVQIYFKMGKNILGKIQWVNATFMLKEKLNGTFENITRPE